MADPCIYTCPIPLEFMVYHELISTFALCIATYIDDCMYVIEKYRLHNLYKVQVESKPTFCLSLFSTK